MRRQKRARANEPVALRKRRTYTEEDRIKAVTAMMQCNGLSIEGIAQARLVTSASISVATLARWLKTYRPIIEASNSQLAPRAIEVGKLAQDTRQQVIANLNEFIVKASERLKQDEVFNDAKLRDIAVSMAVGIDKNLLLTEQYTPEFNDAVRELWSLCPNPTYAADVVLSMADEIRQRNLLAGNSIDITPNS